MKKELVEKLVELEIVERVKKSEIEKMDLSQPVLLLKLTSNFLVVLYHTKSSRINIDQQIGVMNIDGNLLRDLNDDIRTALGYWLKKKPEFGQQYESACQEVQEQFEAVVNIISECFQDMYRKIRGEMA
jgi:hypothetical protein